MDVGTNSNCNFKSQLNCLDLAVSEGGASRKKALADLFKSATDRHNVAGIHQVLLADASDNCEARCLVRYSLEAATDKSIFTPEQRMKDNPEKLLLDEWIRILDSGLSSTVKELRKVESELIAENCPDSKIYIVERLKQEKVVCLRLKDIVTNSSLGEGIQQKFLTSINRIIERIENAAINLSLHPEDVEDLRELKTTVYVYSEEHKEYLAENGLNALFLLLLKSDKDLKVREPTFVVTNEEEPSEPSLRSSPVSAITTSEDSDTNSSVQSDTPTECIDGSEESSDIDEYELPQTSMDEKLTLDMIAKMQTVNADLNRLFRRFESSVDREDKKVARVYLEMMREKIEASKKDPKLHSFHKYILLAGWTPTLKEWEKTLDVTQKKS